MLYGLAHHEDRLFKDHLSKVILMAPCVKPRIFHQEKIFERYRDVFLPASQKKVYSTADSIWPEKMRRQICHKLSVWYCMEYYQDYMVQSLKSIEHYF